MKFDCDNCGPIDYVIIDGYNYGDRLLEGVTFEVRRDDNGKFHSQVEDFSREYFAQFNQDMYLDMINEGMEHEEFAVCPTCGEEVVINKIAPRPTQTANLQTFGSILGMLGAVGTVVAPEDVGDVASGNDQSPAEEEETETSETSSTEGGDTGGGGVSEDLPENESDESDDTSDES